MFILSIFSRFPPLARNDILLLYRAIQQRPFKDSKLYSIALRLFNLLK
ncbi:MULTISPECIES: hypothetical protein [unclassified Rickettsia]